MRVDNREVLQRWLTQRLKKAEKEAEKLRSLMDKLSPDNGETVVAILEMIPGFLPRMRREIGIE